MAAKKIMVCLDSHGAEGVDALRVGAHLCREGTADELVATSVVASGDKDAAGQKRLERLYGEELRRFKGIRSSMVELERVGHEKVADQLLAQARSSEASCVVVGIDNKDHDAPRRHSVSHLSQGDSVLGAVADPLIRKSLVPICVVPIRAARDVPPAEDARRWLIAVDGSQLAVNGVRCLATDWANSTDEITVITLSRYDGKNDQAIMSQCREILQEKQFARKDVFWVKRDTQMSVGQQLCTYAWDNEFSFLCTSTGQSSMHRLGSTSQYCMLHSKVSVFVIKTPSVDDVIVAERMSGDMFF